MTQRYVKYYRLLLAALFLALVGAMAWLAASRRSRHDAHSDGSLRFGRERLQLLREARHDHYELRCQLAAKPELSPQKQELLLAFAVKDAKHGALLRWNQRGLRLLQRCADGENILAEQPLALADYLATPLDLLVRVMGDELELIADGRRILRHFAPGLGRGQVACGMAQRQLAVKELRYQRLEPFRFADDFMRTEEEAKEWGQWRPLSGNWKIYSVMERIYDNPAANIRKNREPLADRSPNPFCLSGSAPEEPGLIVTGLPFWCDYQASVSVKPFGGSFGLIFGYRDVDNFWLLRWSAESLAPTPAALELVVREQGVERVLDSVMLLSRAENWWRLGIRQHGERVDALLDGVTVLTVHDPASIGGAVGLYKEGSQEAYFDDLELSSISEISHHRLLSESCQELAGRWFLSFLDEGWPQHPGSAVLSVKRRRGGAPITIDGQSLALCRLGWPHWAAQRFTATLLPLTAQQSPTPAGLLFAWQDKDNYWRGGWMPKDGGQLFLQQLRDGQPEEALSLPYSWSGTEPLRLAVDSRQDGVMQVWAQDQLVLRQRLPAGAGAAAQGGAVGLFGGEGAQFAQICAFAEQNRDWEQPVDIARFTDDPFMQGWASSRYAWLRDDGEDKNNSEYPQRYRHNGDFYGAFTLSAPLQDGLKFFWGLDEVQPGAAYALHSELSAESGSGRLRLLRGEKLLAAAAFSGKQRSVLPGKQLIDEKIGVQPRTPDTESWGRLELWRDGQVIWAAVDGEELFCMHDPTPLTGRCFGVEIPAPMDFIHLELRRESLRDYLFEQAETDWNSVGRWEVTNRFACDPRWSHMNGESRGVAALWSKFALPGDFTIECFAGMRMRQGELQEGAQMSYPRVGDINVAIHGDGRELFSGYNLLLAAWDERWSETWTQFWRKDQLLQQTDREFIPRGRHLAPSSRPVAQEWDPGGRPVHGAWYALKIRRTGSRYDISFDNTPVFSYTDDDPLAGAGKLALWTQHNSIVLARVKLSYRQLLQQAPAVSAEDAAKASAKINAEINAGTAGEAATAQQDKPTPEGSLGAVAGLIPQLSRFQCLSHPSRVLDFESGLDGVWPWHGDQSAQLRILQREDWPSQVLAAENVYSGGDFGLSLPWRDVALQRVAELRLACLIPEGSLINLYFTIKDDPIARYFIRLTGPAHDEANLHCVGVAEGLQQGVWSELRLPVGELLRKRFPQHDQWLLDSAMIGMLHEGYLNAGLGGNHAGASYYLDDIVLLGSGPQSVQCQWQLAGAEPPACRAWLSAEAAVDATPAEAQNFKDEIFSLSAVEDGMAWLQVELLSDDAEAPAQRLPPLPLLISSPPPLNVQPGDGESWGLNPIQVTLPTEPLFWPRLGSLLWSVNGQDLPVHAGNSALDVDTGLLEIQPLFGDMILADTEGMVNASLSYLPVDAAEGSEPTQLSWRLRLDPAADRTPPGPPQLKDARSALCGLRPWQEEGKIANAKSQVGIERYRLPDGTPAARVLNRICGSDFGFSFNLPAFELARHPILIFDYKIAPDSHVDLLLRILGKVRSIGLTDLDPTRNLKLGDCPGIVADGNWHRAQLDLRQYCGEVDSVYDNTGLTTTELAVGNWHYSGEAAGNSYELSRVMLAPLVSSHSNPPILSWQLPDPGEISAYSYLWDRQHDTIPDTVPEGEGGANSLELPALSDGLHFFHIRARDQAGNWGSSAHYPFLVENSLPKIAAVFPEDGSEAAPEQMKLIFAEDGSDWIDFSKVKLSVNGQERRVNRQAMSWDREQRSLNWNLLSLSGWNPLSEPVADGTLFTAEISGIRSFAGCELPPKSWSWRLDYAQDQTPPRPPMVLGNNNAFQNTETFSANHYWRGVQRTSLLVLRDGSIDSQCLEIRHRAEDAGRFQANAGLRRDQLRNCQALRFRYQIAPGSKVNLLLFIEREWYAVRMTGSDETTVIGQIADARDDGQWRWAWLELPELIAKAQPDKPAAQLALIAFGERGTITNDSVLRIDDFSAVSVCGPLPLISLRSTDASGIAAYEAKLSQQADDEPALPLSATSAARALQAADQEGLWFVHARCRDGAGNSSEIIHLPFLCRAPALPQADGDGLEAGDKDVWRFRALQRSPAVRASCWPVRAGENNQLLGLQLPQGRNLPVEFFRELPTELGSEWTQGLSLDLFMQGEGEIELRAAVYVVGQTRPVLSQPLTIKGSEQWQRDQQLLFASEDLPAKNTPRQLALRCQRKGRQQLTILVDKCRFLPQKQAEEKQED
jgi:hypothetical protein